MLVLSEEICESQYVLYIPYKCMVDTQRVQRLEVRFSIFRELYSHLVLNMAVRRVLHIGDVSQIMNKILIWAVVFSAICDSNGDAI